MNREIKFRGKKIYNGNWFYGNLIFRKEESPVIETNAEYKSYYIQTQDFEGEEYEVYPETIGQFTGFYDKNGKEIYEGDVLNFYWFYFDGCGEREVNLKSAVVYYKGCFCFKYGDEMIPLKEYNFEEYPPILLGNIYDNPELLKK